jgi:hypothetical protein
MVGTESLPIGVTIDRVWREGLMKQPSHPSRTAFRPSSFLYDGNGN